MYSPAVLMSVLAATAQARFGQEQVPIAAISALSNFGSSGQAATLAGQSISFLLGAANPCGKLTQADLIVSTLGTDAAVIAAARGLAGAEQNFNPSAVSVPSICDDATLPVTQELRGVVPLVDPAVTGSDAENANAKTSLTSPFDATGLSVAGVMAAQGFSNFTSVASDGTKAAASASGSSNGAAANATSPSTTQGPSNGAAAGTGSAASTLITKTKSKSGSAQATAAAAAASASNSTASTGAATSLAGADFGLCTPTMLFAGGLGGRPATEFTFQATDALVAKGQQEALNPNIITNRICDQLTNVCNANADAKTACTAAKAQVSALGTKDQSTADAWNAALGF